MSRYHTIKMKKRHQIAERRKMVTQYFCRERWPVDEIAIELGVSPDTVRNDIKAIEKEYKKNAVGDYERMVVRELQALEIMEAECIKRLTDCKKPWQGARWMEERRKIIEQRARMLGLNAPDKHVNVNVNARVSKEDRDAAVAAVFESQKQIAAIEDATKRSVDDIEDAEIVEEETPDVATG